MRLLNVETLRLESYLDPDNTPPYAILSHTWEDEEVAFDDLEATPYSKDLWELQGRFDELASRFDDLKRRLESLDRSSAQYPAHQEAYPLASQDTQDTKPKFEATRLKHAKQRKGWRKIEGCCDEVSRLGLTYVWIDTCCIRKDDSVELSEAINSMFTWYRDAELCIAYLSDASSIDTAFGNVISKQSRWFSRGWTLQELIAPSKLLFYQQDWIPLGSRSSLAARIEEITEIPQVVLENGLGGERSGKFSIATKMSWAAHRETTKPEDRAYSLMGLFSVNMPTLYGEGGQSAFFRLQTEVFRASGDHSIFAWSKDQFYVTQHPRNIPDFLLTDSILLADPTNHTFSAADLFALSPKMFAPAPRFQDLPVNLVSRFDVPIVRIPPALRYPKIEPYLYDLEALNIPVQLTSTPKYSAFTGGMHVQLLLEEILKVTPECSVFLAHLPCKMQQSTDVVGIYLISERPGQYRRILGNILVSIELTHHIECYLVLADVYLAHTKLDDRIEPSWRWKEVPLPPDFSGTFCITLVDKQLKRSGFTLSGHSSGKKHWRSSSNDIALTIETRPLLKRQRNVILFESIAKSDLELIAVTWEINLGLCVSVQGTDDPNSPITNINAAWGTFPFTRYPLNQDFTSHWGKRWRNRGDVYIVFRQVGGDKVMHISIF